MSLITPTHDEWLRIRSEGKGSYIRRAGLREFALGYGLVIWLIFVVIVPTLFAADAPNLTYFASPTFWFSTLAALVLWPLGGLLLARFLWRKYEKRWGSAG